MFNPDKTCQRIGDRLFPTRLHIGQFAVRNPRSSAPRQVIEPMHLRTARRQQRLLGLPPDIAPVRRSDTKGQVPKMHGAPGSIALA